jgi:hypothetical protein
VGLEAGSQLKSQGKWLGVGGPSVGLYVPLLEFNQWLKIRPLSFKWGLPSKFDSNPLIWMLTVNGMMVDVRHLPIEVQEVAYQKGLIPYVPGAKHS